jgi:hypothetical protein
MRTKHHRLPRPIKPTSKGKTAGKVTKPAGRALDAKLEALSKDEQFAAALDRFLVAYELRNLPAGPDLEDPAVMKLLSEWEQGFPMTRAERQTLEELGVLLPDGEPEPVEVGELVPVADLEAAASVIAAHETAELADLLMSVAIRLRTAAAPGAAGREAFAGSLEPVLPEVATAVRLLAEFLNVDCEDNALLPRAVEKAKQSALSWPGLYYAQPAVQIREQKRYAKLASKLPLRMRGAKQPSVYACAAVDVLMAVQEHIFWLRHLQPRRATRTPSPAWGAARSALAQAIAESEEHPLRLPVDTRGKVEAPATWGAWKRLFECVAVLRHGTAEEREAEVKALRVDPDDLPQWLRPVEAYADELTAKTERRGSRVLGEIREHMRNYFCASLFDMTRPPRRATRRKQ